MLLSHFLLDSLGDLFPRDFSKIIFIFLQLAEVSQNTYISYYREESSYSPFLSAILNRQNKGNLEMSRA
jgi:hypothetical protein